MLLKRFIQDYTIKRLVNARENQTLTDGKGKIRLLILCDFGQMGDGQVGDLIKKAALERSWDVVELSFLPENLNKEEHPEPHQLYKNQLSAFGLPLETWLRTQKFAQKDLIIDISTSDNKALKFIGLHANPKLWVKMGASDTDYDWNFTLTKDQNPKPIIDSFFHFISTLK
jgi:hypothetical protein